MSQDDDIEAALAEIEEKVERVKEQAQERGESEGVQLKRCYDKARSERKSLEQELEERIKEHPELRRLQEKVKQAKEREKEAKKDWRTEVYEPAKRDAERLKNKREGRLAQLEEQLLDWVEERGRVGLVEAYEGAKSRADIEGTTIEKKGVTFRVKTWESMRLDDEIDDP